MELKLKWVEVVLEIMEIYLSGVECFPSNCETESGGRDEKAKYLASLWASMDKVFKRYFILLYLYLIFINKCDFLIKKIKVFQILKLAMDLELKLVLIYLPPFSILQDYFLL